MGSIKTKKEIIETASKLFGQNGFQQTTMDEIARVANKAKGSLYYHFTSKEELFAEVINVEIEDLISQLSEIVDNDQLKAESKIRNYLLTRMMILNEANNFKESIRLSMINNNEYITKVRNRLAEFEKRSLKKIILQGIEEGEFTDIKRSLDTIVEVFIIVQKGLESPFFLYGNYKKYSYHFYDMINILVKGLKN